MYKNRFTKWGFDQKYKKRNSDISCRLHKQNPQEIVSDGPSPPDCSTTASAEGDSSREEPLTTQTNWSSTTLMTMAVPKPPLISEPLDHAIFCYFSASFQGRLWVSEGEETHCRSVIAPPKIYDIVSRFKHDLIAACNYIHQQGTRYGFAYLHQGSEKIKDIVSAECPRVTADLIEISLWLIKQDRYDVVRIFLRQFADMSAIFNSQSQAIYRILAHKSTSGCSSFEEAALNACRFIAGYFIDQLGLMHVTALCCYTNWLVYFAGSLACDRYICRTKCDHAEYAETLLRSALKRCDDARGPVSTQSVMVLQALVQVLLVRQHYMRAEELCNDIMSRARIAQRHDTLFTALKSISDTQNAQKNVGRAEENLKKLVEVSASYWGRDSSKTIYHMTVLERFLAQQGRFQEAAKLRAKLFDTAVVMDPLSVSLTQPSMWLSDGSSAWCPAIQENLDRLKSSMKSSHPESKLGPS